MQKAIYWYKHVLATTEHMFNPEDRAEAQRKLKELGAEDPGTRNR